MGGKINVGLANQISRKYARAPITEAIIELRVAPASRAASDSCKRAVATVHDQFPDLKEVMMMEAQLMAGQLLGAHATQKVVGYTRSSGDRRQSVTAMLDRFAFSRLPPYTAWEDFCPVARDLWKLYAIELKPELVTRIATRFVNRIEIPQAGPSWTEYFRTAPVISAEMPQKEIGGAFMQLQLPQRDLACNVVLNFAILPAGEGALPIILDIDVSEDLQEDPSSNVIWARLEEFRWRKNDIFESCITDKVRELIS